MNSVAKYAREVKIPVHTIYSRMLKMYGLKKWKDYTLDEIRSVSKPAKRPMKRRRKHK